ncbi:unnamed protein product [Rotaria socialis]|uniref:Uncharacterized protein n=1 Tax=Rotaria socialis TaxID=392032 RepID=A0A821HJB9_9BILA|nr:unnamed protein product [Rotaria socialis]
MKLLFWSSPITVTDGLWSFSVTVCIVIAIKDEHTFRERHPLSRFFTIANGIVNRWPTSRNPNQTDAIIFSTEPTITLQKCTNAYHFAKSSKSILQMSSTKKGFVDYYIPAGEADNVTPNEIQRYKRKKWTSFDQFKDIQFRIWKVTLSDNGSELNGRTGFAIVQASSKNTFASILLVWLLG